MPFYEFIDCNCILRISISRELPDSADDTGALKNCFISGTDWEASSLSSNCICTEDYHGNDCGIPDAVWHSHYNKKEKERNLLRV